MADLTFPNVPFPKVLPKSNESYSEYSCQWFWFCWDQALLSSFHEEIHYRSSAAKNITIYLLALDDQESNIK